MLNLYLECRMYESNKGMSKEMKKKGKKEKYIEPVELRKH